MNFLNKTSIRNIFPVLLLASTIGVVVFMMLGNEPAPMSAPVADKGTRSSAQEISPLLQFAPRFKCREGMDPNVCEQLVKSCGNGVCDGFEKCNTCPFDCGCTGDSLCNPDTGFCYQPGGVCNQVRQRIEEALPPHGP